MKTAILTLILFLSINSIHAIQNNETCDCKSEIVHYYNASKQLESYKTQIKRNQAEAYDLKFAEAKENLTGKETFVECYLILADLSTLIKDEHARVYMNGFDYGENGSEDNQTNATKLKSSAYFQQLPRTTVNLDSLKVVLDAKKQNEVEGIYKYSKITVGIYKSSSDWYTAVVLSSQSNFWETGMIKGYYRHIAGDRYQAVFSTQSHTQWYNIRNDEFHNGRFFISRATKESVVNQFDEIDSEASLFEYKKLENNTDYIRLGSFSRMTSNWNKSKELVNEIKGNLKGDHLIIDLRNNSGGADKVSKPYWKMAKKFAKKGNVYVLVNNYTTSNAEITTEMISRNENVTIVGRNTNGVCSYGSNYGNIVNSDSGRFFMVLTDMDYKYLLPYEEIGIPVDIELDLEKEWLPQVMDLIKNK